MQENSSLRHAFVAIARFHSPVRKALLRRVCAASLRMIREHEIAREWSNLRVDLLIEQQHIRPEVATFELIWYSEGRRCQQMLIRR